MSSRLRVCGGNHTSSRKTMPKEARQKISRYWFGTLSIYRYLYRSFYLIGGLSHRGNAAIKNHARHCAKKTAPKNFGAGDKLTTLNRTDQQISPVQADEPGRGRLLNDPLDMRQLPFLIHTFQHDAQFFRDIIVKKFNTYFPVVLIS